MSTQTLTLAIRRALLASTALAAMTGTALAQDAAAPAQQTPAQASTAQDAPTTLDRIEVTGSRIRQVDIESERPVLTISRQEIERQGMRSVADILQNISASGPPALSRSQPLASGENSGGSFVNLRNLGPQRVLVLLNGKRLGTTTAGLADVSIIPAAMVERVEVLKDGASSIYGSDAIAGVVNIITRSNYDGAQINAQVGNFSEGDGARTTVDGVIGFSGDRGSVTAGAEYSKEEEVWARDRWFSAYPRSDRHAFLPGSWTTVSQWGGLTGLPGGTRVLDRGADPRFFSNYHVLNPAIPDGDVSNPNAQMHVFNPLVRKSVFVDGTIDITDDVRFRGNLMYANRVSERAIAGYPYQSAVFGTPLAADSYYNPVGTWHGFATPQQANFFRRTWEVPRVAESDLDTWRFSGVLEGTLTWGEKYFDWDAGFLHNKNSQIISSTGNLNVPNARLAVGPSFLNTAGVVQCGTPAAPIPVGPGPGQCIPWNPLLPFGREGSGGLTNNADLQNFLFPEEHATGETKTTSYFANISGPLFALPGGDLAFALGYEYRKEQGKFTPDAMSQAGNTTNLVSAPTQGSYAVDELFLELSIPLLADVAFAKELSLNLSSRYSDYNTFGDTTNSKFGFKWKPFDDLLVRGTWSEGFRAPTIADLFGGGSQTFPNFTDPCDTRFGAAATSATVLARCAQDITNAAVYRQLAQGFTPTTTANAQTPLAFFGGASNPLLLPETSTSKTLGLVWSPGFIEGLGMSLDWWKIRIESTIVADSATQMLNDCYVSQINARCQFFTRDPVLGIINSLTFGGRNAGYVMNEGYDFDVAYRLDTDWGKFGITWQTTYLSKGEFKSVDNPAIAPTPVVSFGGVFRVRSNLMVNWDKGPFGVTWGTRYQSGMKEACLNATAFPEECSDPNYRSPAPGLSGPLNRVGSNTFHDLQVRWNAPWNATVAVGANNVFGHFGPPMYSQPNANFSYFGGFDIGRFVYLKYQQRF